jgi:hypothetical protein
LCGYLAGHQTQRSGPAGRTPEIAASTARTETGTETDRIAIEDARRVPGRQTETETDDAGEIADPAPDLRAHGGTEATEATETGTEIETAGTETETTGTAEITEAAMLRQLRATLVRATPFCSRPDGNWRCWSDSPET